MAESNAVRLTGDEEGWEVGSAVSKTVSGFTKTDMLAGQLIVFTSKTLDGLRPRTLLMSTIPVL